LTTTGINFERTPGGVVVGNETGILQSLKGYYLKEQPNEQAAEFEERRPVEIKIDAQQP
jgi:hypothetical protein